MITFFDRTDDAGDQLRVSAFDSDSDGPLLMLTAKGQQQGKAVYLNRDQIVKLATELHEWLATHPVITPEPPVLWEGESL